MTDEAGKGGKPPPPEEPRSLWRRLWRLVVGVPWGEWKKRVEAAARQRREKWKRKVRKDAP